MSFKKPSHSELRDMLAAHALGALPPDDHDRLAVHLLDCESCQGELREFEATVSWMESDSPRLPDDFQDRVFERIAQEDNVRTLTPRKTWRVASLGVAASFLVLVSAWSFYDARRAEDAELKSREVVRAIQEADEPVIRTTAGGITASLVLGDDETLFLVSDLPAPKESRTYQLWVQVGQTYESVGTFELENALASVAIDRPHGTFKAALVTDEPIGGSIQPTTVPLVAVSTDVS